MLKSGMSLGKRLNISFTVIIAFMAALAILSSSRITALNTESVSQATVRGGDVVLQVVTTMGAIHASSKPIADIIGVIDSIAIPSNSMALNTAMVEGASSAAQSMHNEAGKLSNAISVFKLDDDGDANQITDVQAIGHVA